MKVIFIDPILAIQGKISSDYYCRRLANGKNVIQKKPDRSNHVKTQREADNQKRFAERFAGRSAERSAERSAGKTSTSPSQRVSAETPDSSAPPAPPGIPLHQRN